MKWFCYTAFVIKHNHDIVHDEVPIYMIAL